MKFSDIPSAKNVCILCAENGLISYTLGKIVYSILKVVITFILGLFIDSLLYGRNAVIYFSLLVCCALTSWLLDLFLRITIIKIARNKEEKLQCLLLSAIQSMQPSAVDVYHNGEVAIKFFRDAGTLAMFIENIYPQFLNMFFGFFFALIAVLYKKPLIAGLYLLFLPTILFFMFLYARRLSIMNQKIRLIYDHSMNSIFEFIHNFPYLKSMSADTPYFHSSKAKFHAYQRINTINDKTIMKLEFLNRFLLLSGEYSVLGIAGWMAWKKMIPVGDVVMFQILFLSVLNSFSSMFQMLPGWKSTQESAYSISKMLKTQETENIDSNPPIPTAKTTITARSISFQYPGDSKDVITDFSCEIKPGTVIALTGENGCGKTTLLKLLTGYLLPQKGFIEIAGKKLSEWQIKSFRQKISYVFQDTLLISGTIRDNITLKNAKYTEQELQEALQLSGADQITARMINGLNHKIGFDGGGLSGGERQMIAIARALIRKPQILIFDEVTNHLDYHSRLKITNLIQSFRGKITVFMVSHDPELVKLCDQEIKLEK